MFTGLATLIVLEIAPPMSFVALLLLLLPFAILCFALVVNGLFLLGDDVGTGWTVAFVLAVAVLAGLQVWSFRVMARNWRTAGTDPGPDLGLRRAGETGSF